jgi:hypothetical protein
MVSIGTGYSDQQAKIKKMYKRLKIIILCFFIFNSIEAQLPKNDIYLAVFSDLSTNPVLQHVTFLNGFNKSGYNNQPIFISNDELMVTCGIDTSRFTDLYRMNINTKEFFKFSATDGISEFSANVAPQKGRMTCVRIEPDGKDQSLWSYPANRSDQGFRILPKLKNIGYYCWINQNEVALFLVGSPHRLVIADITSGRTSIVSENIGRCLKYDGNGLLYFVHKITPDTWQLKTYHHLTKKVSIVCQMPSGREDYELLSNGNILTPDGSKIKMIKPNLNSEWQDIADLTDLGIKSINRITVSGDKVVFVNNK